jgi:hypothetical protein
MIQPDGVADNFRGKTVTLIAGCLDFYHASLPQTGYIDNSLPLSGQ